MLKVLSKVFIFISSLCILQSCFLYGNKDSLSLSTAIKNKSDLKSTLSFINVSHNKVNIQGTGFLNITSVKLIGKSVNTELNIESKSDSEIIASISNAVTLMVGEAFNLVFTTVNAQATYEVIFALQNGAIKLNHLSSLGATTAGQILKFDGTSWGLGVLQNSQMYLGTWNASTHFPDITSLGSFTPGDYYIVSTAGSYTSGILSESPTIFALGDWVIFNGTNWEKVSNASLTGSGSINHVPYYSSSNVLANSPIVISGSNIGIGTITPGSSLDIKGALRLSGATSGFIGFKSAPISDGTTYTLPETNGTSGQVLTTNVSGDLSWTTVLFNGGAISEVKSANTDIGIVSGQTTPVLTLNSGTNANQILKLTAVGKLPAVDGSLLTNLTSTNLIGTVAVENGGTGATSLGTSQSALGITKAGPLTGNTPILGATIVADRLCTSDPLGSTISCLDNLPASTIKTSVSGTSGTGNLLFGTSPTITSPIISNINPSADFTLTQNSVIPFTSSNIDAVANTLYLKKGSVGIGTISPLTKFHVNGGAGTAVSNSLTAQAIITGAAPTDALTVPRLIIATNSTFSLVGQSSGELMFTRRPIGSSYSDHGSGVRQYIDSNSDARNNGLQFFTSNAYSKNEGKMTIDSFGNVGIGTMAPSLSLDIQNKIYRQQRLWNTNSSQQLWMGSIGNTVGTFIGSNAYYSTNYKFIPNFTAASGMNFRQDGSTEFWNDSGLTVGTSYEPSKSMVITNVGQVGIGLTNPTQKLDVAGNIQTSGCLYYASSSLGMCASDKRIKKEIHSFNLGLEVLLGINPVNFKYNGLAGFNVDGKEQLGVVAQELENVAPGLVKKQMVKLNQDDLEKTEIKVVDYGAITYVIINAVKQFYHKWLDDNQTIHHEISSLKNDLASVSKIKRLESEAATLQTTETIKKEVLALRIENNLMRTYLCEKDPKAIFCK